MVLHKKMYQALGTLVGKLFLLAKGVVAPFFPWTSLSTGLCHVGGEDQTMAQAYAKTSHLPPPGMQLALSPSALRWQHPKKLRSKGSGTRNRSVSA